MIPRFSAEAVADAIESSLRYFGGAEGFPYGDGQSSAKIAQYLVEWGGC